MRWTILVGGNVGEVLFTIIGTALGTGRAPVGTRQLLLVNLLTDMFPALAVAVTPQYAEPEEAEDETDRRRGGAATRAFQRAVLTEPTPSLDAPADAPDRHPRRRHGRRRNGSLGHQALDTGHRTPHVDNGTHRTGDDATRANPADPPPQPARLATALGSAGVLVAIVQTPGVSHFFGCTPLGPVAWSGVSQCHRRRYRRLGAGAQLASQTGRCLGTQTGVRLPATP